MSEHIHPSLITHQTFDLEALEGVFKNYRSGVLVAAGSLACGDRRLRVPLGRASQGASLFTYSGSGYE